MKKLILLLFIPLVFTCSKDSRDDIIEPPTNFYEAHNGVWITTYEDGTQNLLDIYDDGWDVYYRGGTTGCFGIAPDSSGASSITTIYTNTPTELYGETTNIPASNIFSGDELQAILDAGYTEVSIAQSFLNYLVNLQFGYVMIIYAGNFEEELLTVTSVFDKRLSNNFSICREISNDNIYQALELLKAQ